MWDKKLLIRSRIETEKCCFRKVWTSFSSPAYTMALRLRHVVLVLPLFIFCTMNASGTNFFRIVGRKFMSENGRWFFEHIIDNTSSNFLVSWSNFFFIDAAEGFNRTSVSFTWPFRCSTASTMLVKVFMVTGLNYFFAVFTMALAAIRGFWDEPFLQLWIGQHMISRFLLAPLPLLFSLDLFPFSGT